MASTTPRPRQGYGESQPTPPSKPPQYMRQSNHSASDLSSTGSIPRRVHGAASNQEGYGWYTAPTRTPQNHSPPPIPPKVSGSGRSSDSNIGGPPRPYAHKVRDFDGPSNDGLIAELEGDIQGIGLSNVGDGSRVAKDGLKKSTTSQKPKKLMAMEALAQEIVRDRLAPPQKRRLRVLSLDGGGIRGYSTLVIMSDLMHRIHVIINKNVPVEPHKLPRPCDFFDIIGGNGTGGLIALMLGRMRMDVETCKEYYESLTRYVFYTDKTILGMPYGNTLFKASRLEEAIKVCVRECTRYDHLPLLHYVPIGQGDSPGLELPQIQPTSTIRSRSCRKGSWGKERKLSNASQEYPTTSTFSSFSSSSTVGKDSSRHSKESEFSSFAAARGRAVDNTLGNPDTPLFDHRVGACKTLVTTSYISSPRGSPPVLLRSYQTARDSATVSTKATIWQAGRATCATRAAFKPITIANVQFLDEGYGKYNPAQFLLDEALAKETWHDTEDVVPDDDPIGPEIGVFVSIGTGKRFSTAEDGPYKPGGIRKDKPLWWESMGMLEQYSEAKKRLLEKLEDCETVHQSLLNGELEKRGVDKTNYYRFNVEVGVGEFGMNEWNRLAEVSTGTRRYLARPDVEKDIKACAEKLANIWRENDSRDKWKMGIYPEQEIVPSAEEAQAPKAAETLKKREAERAKRRAGRKDSTGDKGGLKQSSPPVSPTMIAELEADIDQAASEWSSNKDSYPSSTHKASEDYPYAGPYTIAYGTVPQQTYNYPVSTSPQEYFSPLPPNPQRPQQGYQPQNVSRWVQNIPAPSQRPIPIPTPADFLPRIVTSPPPQDNPGQISYPIMGPNPEIRVTSPTTVAGDETPPGTPTEFKKARSIEGDRQARRERRERKMRKEQEERERLQSGNMI